MVKVMHVRTLGRAAFNLVAALMLALLLPGVGHAAVSAFRAEVNGGNQRIEGTAAGNRTITVDVVMGASDAAGRFGALRRTEMVLMAARPTTPRRSARLLTRSELLGTERYRVGWIVALERENSDLSGIVGRRGGGRTRGPLPRDEGVVLSATVACGATKEQGCG